MHTFIKEARTHFDNLSFHFRILKTNKIYSKEAKEIKKIKMGSMKLKTEKQQKTSMSKKMFCEKINKMTNFWQN